MTASKIVSQAESPADRGILAVFRGSIALHLKLRQGLALRGLSVPVAVTKETLIRAYSIPKKKLAVSDQETASF